MIPEREKILKNYPFEKLEPPVKLVEGFEAYDGVIGDQPGVSHKGIDYVRKDKDRFLSFDIYSCQDGVAFQGISKSWGKFVSIRQRVGNIRLETIYTHLRNSHPQIPPFPKDEEELVEGWTIRAGEWLGKSGISGRTKRRVQLHFETHRKNLKTGSREKIDPYGIYARASSGRYPQPGESLKGLPHYFSSDNPPFAERCTP